MDRDGRPGGDDEISRDNELVDPVTRDLGPVPGAPDTVPATYEGRLCGRRSKRSTTTVRRQYRRRDSDGMGRRTGPVPDNVNSKSPRPSTTYPRTLREGPSLRGDRSSSRLCTLHARPGPDLIRCSRTRLGHCGRSSGPTRLLGIPEYY